MALLGWSPPHMEDSDVLMKTVSAIEKYDVMGLRDLEETFNIYKIGKASVKWSDEKLIYLNSHHIREQFRWFNEEERLSNTQQWRSVSARILPDL